LGTGAGDKLPAADGAAPSSAAAGTAAAVGSKPGEATDSSALVPAVAAGVLGAGAPRKLFVREYNVGQLVREYPLTAEEIKMIFGFLWPKANKVCGLLAMAGGVGCGGDGVRALLWSCSCCGLSV
jgi:DNA-binding transcriptional LysR family regulator